MGFGKFFEGPAPNLVLFYGLRLMMRGVSGIVANGGFSDNIYCLL